MKKILVLVLIIVTIFGLYTYIIRHSIVQAPQDDTSFVTKTNDGDYKPTTTFTGKKNIVLLKSTFNWEGKKTILKEWIDTGFIDAESGHFIFEKGHITEGEIIINMNSIKAIHTGSGSDQDQLTKHLKSQDWFNVTEFPTSKFTIQKVEKNIMSGDITIKGVTKQISFPITSVESNGQFIVSGKIVIDRTLFGIQFGSTNFIKNLADKAIIDNNFSLSFKIILE